MQTDRTAQIINSAKSLCDSLEKLTTQLSGPQEPSEVLLKILKQLTVTVENSLPDLRDYVDTLEFQEDSRADDLLKIINKLEDELLVKAIEFIKKIRFSEACRLLKEGRYNIAEISSMVGFSTPSYFATSFKKYIGCLPTEYIKQQK